MMKIRKMMIMGMNPWSKRRKMERKKLMMKQRSKCSKL